MRVVGYVRESSDPSDDRPAFSQQEELRRHATERGHRLVAVCQDLRSVGEPATRDGYLSLLGVVATGAVDAVLLPGIATLSSDAIVQEIMLWDLQGRGARIISTDPTDLALLDPAAAPEPSRMVIRDVLQRVEEHSAGLSSQPIETTAVLPDGEVMVHMIAADTAAADTAAADTAAADTVAADRL